MGWVLSCKDFISVKRRHNSREEVDTTRVHLKNGAKSALGERDLVGCWVMGCGICGICRICGIDVGSGMCASGCWKWALGSGLRELGCGLLGVLRVVGFGK